MGKGNLVRFIGGPAAGDEMWVKGDRFRIPAHPDMSVCDSCKPEDFANENEQNMHVVEYIVHKFNFGTGHRHLYAAPVGTPAVGVFNDLWHEYKKAKQK